VLLLLAACGTAGNEDSPIGQSIAALRTDADFVPRFITLIKEEAPTLQVGFIDTETSGNVLLERQDGAFAYWLSPDGGQIVLQDGMLHSVRGFGEGLLASELSEPLALVRGLQSGWSDRFHTYLDGNDFAVTRTYRCRIENRGPRELNLFGTPTDTRLMREDCRSLDQEFVNLYWVAPSSRNIIVSRQWVGPVVGAISTRIVPR
ncbi:MAG: YjbF family lipoprotein, partial [Pseudomonadota bacterium]